MLGAPKKRKRNEISVTQNLPVQDSGLNTYFIAAYFPLQISKRQVDQGYGQLTVVS